MSSIPQENKDCDNSLSPALPQSAPHAEPGDRSSIKDRVMSFWKKRAADITASETKATEMTASDKDMVRAKSMTAPRSSTTINGDSAIQKGNASVTDASVQRVLFEEKESKTATPDTALSRMPSIIKRAQTWASKFSSTGTTLSKLDQDLTQDGNDRSDSLQVFAQQGTSTPTRGSPTQISPKLKKVNFIKKVSQSLTPNRNSSEDLSSTISPRKPGKSVTPNRNSSNDLSNSTPPQNASTSVSLDRNSLNALSKVIPPQKTGSSVTPVHSSGDLAEATCSQKTSTIFTTTTSSNDLFDTTATAPNSSTSVDPNKTSSGYSAKIAIQKQDQEQEQPTGNDRLEPQVFAQRKAATPTQVSPKAKKMVQKKTSTSVIPNRTFSDSLSPEQQPASSPTLKNKMLLKSSGASVTPDKSSSNFLSEFQQSSPRAKITPSTATNSKTEKKSMSIKTVKSSASASLTPNKSSSDSLSKVVEASATISTQKKKLVIKTVKSSASLGLTPNKNSKDSLSKGDQSSETDTGSGKKKVVTRAVKSNTSLTSSKVLTDSHSKLEQSSASAIESTKQKVVSKSLVKTAVNPNKNSSDFLPKQNITPASTSSSTDSSTHLDQLAEAESSGVPQSNPAHDHAKQRIWLLHPTLSWVLGSKISKHGHLITENDDFQNYTYEYNGQPFVPTSEKDLHPFVESDLRYYDDAVEMANLHDAPILSLLRDRYSGIQQISPASDENEPPDNQFNIKDMVPDSMDHRMRIYTFVGGDVLLVSINPCKLLPNLYDNEVMFHTRECGELTSSRFSYLPHVYSIADATVESMIREHMPQSIITSGVSGAGKTEACKQVLKYLAYRNFEISHKLMSRSNREEIEGHNFKEDGIPHIETKIISANPLLEAFGNAKTVKNHNSSRFGKLIQVRYNNQGLISGAFVRQYLLEKTRVVKPGKQERNFHIFYQLCKGASPEEKKRFRLLDLNNYNYINCSDCFEIADQDDAEEFHITKQAMDDIGFDQYEKDVIFSITSAVLRLGNVRISSVEDEEHLERAVIDDLSDIQPVADLLQVDVKSLISALTSRTIVVGGERFVKGYSVDQAISVRDGLAKHLYQKLFEFIIMRLNDLFNVDYDSFGSEPDDDNKLFIAILDQTGFENFETNSLEQLLINYGNEKMQIQFHERISSVERAVYQAEGIDWDAFVGFLYDTSANATRVGALDSNPGGILTLLNDECAFPKGNDQHFLDKVLSEATNAYMSNAFTNGLIFRPKGAGSRFGFEHYAEPVIYSVDNIVEKNKDSLHKDISEVIMTSKNIIVAMLFEEDLVDSERKNDATAANPDRESLRRYKTNRASGVALRSDSYVRRTQQTVSKLLSLRTVWSSFQPQLNELVTILESTCPRYIRCIKPNDKLKKDTFDSPQVLSQLRTSGILEFISVRRNGLPVRLPFIEFCDRYYMFIKDRSISHKKQCQKVLQTESDRLSSEKHRWQIGHTKVFITDSFHKHLESRRNFLFRSAISDLQSLHRTIVQKNMFKKERLALYIQSMLLRKPCLTEFEAKKDTLNELQSALRKSFYHKRLRLFKQAIARLRYGQGTLVLCKGMRRWKEANDRKLRDKARLVAASDLQAISRRHKALSKFSAILKDNLKKKTAALLTQCSFRCKRQQQNYLQSKNQIIEAQTVLRQSAESIKREYFVSVLAVIQKCILREQGKMPLLKEICHCTSIQKAVRIFFARQHFESKRVFSVILQTSYRALIEKLQHERKLQNIVALQSFIKALQGKIPLSGSISSTILLQNVGKKFLSTQHHSKDKSKCIALQNVMKKFMSVQHRKSNRHSAILLQTIRRGCLDKRDHQQNISDVLTLQSSIQRQQGKSKHEHTLRDIVTIQSSILKHQVNIPFGQNRSNIRTLQALLRKTADEETYRCDKAHVLLLQRVIRTTVNLADDIEQSCSTEVFDRSLDLVSRSIDVSKAVVTPGLKRRIPLKDMKENIVIIQSSFRRLKEKRNRQECAQLVDVLASCMRTKVAQRLKKLLRSAHPSRFKSLVAQSPLQLVVCGPDGVGKSFLSNLLSGLDQPTSDEFDSLSDIGSDLDELVKEIRSECGSVLIYDTGSLTDLDDRKTLESALHYPDKHSRSIFIFVDRIDSHRAPKEALRIFMRNFGSLLWGEHRQGLVVLTHADTVNSSNTLLQKKMRAFSSIICTSNEPLVTPSKLKPHYTLVKELIKEDVSETTSVTSGQNEDNLTDEISLTSALDEVHLFAVDSVTGRSTLEGIKSLANIYDQLEELSSSRNKIVETSVHNLLQYARTGLAVQRKKELHNEAAHVQSISRLFLSLNTLKSSKEKLAAIQSAMRRSSQMKEIAIKKQAMVDTQRLMRRTLADNQYQRLRDAVGVIQNGSRSSSACQRRERLFRASCGRFQNSEGKQPSVVIFGPPGVGKSSFINYMFGDKRRDLHDSYQDLEYDVTSPSKKTEAAASKVHYSPEGTSLNMYDTKGIVEIMEMKVIAQYLKNMAEHPITSFVFIDRFDSHRISKDVLRAASIAFGPSFWSRAVVVLTHKDIIGDSSETYIEEAITGKAQAINLTLRDISKELVASVSDEPVPVFALSTKSKGTTDEELVKIGAIMDCFERHAKSEQEGFAFQVKEEKKEPDVQWNRTERMNKHMQRKAYYEILGLEADATPVDIKRAYRLLAMKYHPDRNLDDTETSQKVFRQVTEAYNVLSGNTKIEELGALGVDEAFDVALASVAVPIYIKTAHNRYWGISGGEVVASRRENELGPDEMFVIRRTYGRRFVIRASDGRHVAIDYEGKLVLKDLQDEEQNRIYVSRGAKRQIPKTVFRIIFAQDGKCNVMASNDRYVAGERNGKLIANRIKAQKMENFEWCLAPHKNEEDSIKFPVVVNLRCEQNRRFVEVDPLAPELICRGQRGATAERFCLEPGNKKGKYRLRCSDGRFVCVKNKSDGFTVIAIDEAEKNGFPYLPGAGDFDMEFGPGGRISCWVSSDEEHLKTGASSSSSSSSAGGGGVFGIFGGNRKSEAEKLYLSKDNQDVIGVRNRRGRDGEFLMRIVFEDHDVMRMLEAYNIDTLPWERDGEAASMLDDEQDKGVSLAGAVAGTSGAGGSAVGKGVARLTNQADEVSAMQASSAFIFSNF